MKILYVIENERYGGGERSFAHLIKGLDRHRYEIYVACLTSPSNCASVSFTREIEGFARIIHFDLRRLVNPFAIFALKRIILENSIKIIHSQGARADFYTRMAAIANRDIALVSTVASPVEEYNVNFIKKAVYTGLDRFREDRVDKFIAVADHIKLKIVGRRGISAKKIERIYNGIDMADYSMQEALAANTRSYYNIPADCFLAGAFCRLSWEKGLFYFIESAKIIADKGSIPGKYIKYLIAGEGPLERDLKSFAKRLGLEDSFIFTGFIEDVRPLLGAVDLFVLPSFREGFPISILEAMAMGKPVIASNIDGINESVVDDYNGLLIPPKDGSALAEAITALSSDRARAIEMGAHGRTMVLEKFGLDKMVKAHNELYMEIVNL